MECGARRSALHSLLFLLAGIGCTLGSADRGDRDEVPDTGLGVALLDEGAVTKGVADVVKGDVAGNAGILNGRNGVGDIFRKNGA